MSEDVMKDYHIYEITNRITGEKSYQVATNAHDACQLAGWLIADCFVIEQKPARRHTPEHGSHLLVKIPCETCPYQYAECKKLEGDECPTRNELPELADWLVQAAKAHLCDHVGQELEKRDYLLKQKWLTVEDAIKELLPKT